MKKVSIIILNWNGLKYTQACIESVKRLDYSNYEIVVVDNGSTDNTAELVASARSDETRASYQALTDEALARGVFGAPTYFYNDEMFWGQDRLDFLDLALSD